MNRLKHIPKSQKPSNFLMLRQLDSGCWRWIEYVGWEVDRFFSTVYILSPLGGMIELANPLCFGLNRRRCMDEKERLNSEIVKDTEPENWIATWKEAYARTH